MFSITRSIAAVARSNARLSSPLFSSVRPMSLSAVVDLVFPEETKEYQSVARAFADKELAPNMSHWDENEIFQGYSQRLLIWASQLLVLAVSTSASSSPTLALGSFDTYGSQALREEYLPVMAPMDASILAFISGAGESEIYVILARTGGPGPRYLLFCRGKGTPGLSFGKKRERLDGTHRLLEQEGRGFNIATLALNIGRMNIAACGLGGAQAALETTIIQFKLAEMATQLTTSRLMIREAARQIDINSPSAPSWAAIAKIHATDNCFEQYMRDLRVHQILGGTNQIMREIVAESILKPQLATFTTMKFALLSASRLPAMARSFSSSAAASKAKQSPHCIYSKEVAERSQVIITMLPTANHVRTVFLGENGLSSGVQKGALLMDSSTGDPPLQGSCQAFGSKVLLPWTRLFLEHTEIFEQAKPFLDSMGKNIVNCGGNGVIPEYSSSKDYEAVSPSLITKDLGLASAVATESKSSIDMGAIAQQILQLTGKTVLVTWSSTKFKLARNSVFAGLTVTVIIALAVNMAASQNEHEISYQRFSTTDDLIYALMDLYSDIQQLSYNLHINQAPVCSLACSFILGKSGTSCL
ncbi:hypothetical protein BSLG_005893 [Batrachochytrium salamandrivorans]|nr:hypothetical protein BSLG_005893 [Batrachochytrium salamandrivorans]